MILNILTATVSKKKQVKLILARFNPVYLKYYNFKMSSIRKVNEVFYVFVYEVFESSVYFRLTTYLQYWTTQVRINEKA